MAAPGGGVGETLKMRGSPEGLQYHPTLAREVDAGERDTLGSVKICSLEGHTQPSLLLSIGLRQRVPALVEPRGAEEGSETEQGSVGLAPGLRYSPSPRESGPSVSPIRRVSWRGGRI